MVMGESQDNRISLTRTYRHIKAYSQAQSKTLSQTNTSSNSVLLCLAIISLSYLPYYLFCYMCLAVYLAL